jgi:hypothetical protein
LTSRAASTKLLGMTEYQTREDGKPYETRVIAETTCGYCGASITQRAEGRTRQFCDSTCRSGSYRKSRVTHRVKAGRKVSRRQ